MPELAAPSKDLNKALGGGKKRGKREQVIGTIRCKQQLSERSRFLDFSNRERLLGSVVEPTLGMQKVAD